ncbi:hypothetical protein [Haloferax gibbonsii]|nr:hypothetical protein [Haloferax gibbonsii]
MPVSRRYRVALGCYALWLVATVLLIALGLGRMVSRGWRFLVGDDAS